MSIGFKTRRMTMSTLPVEYFAYTPKLRAAENPKDVDTDYVDPYTRPGVHGDQLVAFRALADAQLDLVEYHTRGHDLEEKLFVFCGPEFYFKYKEKYPFSNSVIIKCWFPRRTEPVFPPRSEPPLSMVF
jgi:hypothetical protein